MARDRNPQSDPWAVEPASVRLYRREHERRSGGTSGEDCQNGRGLLSRLRGWQQSISAMDDSPSSPAPRRRILTEQDYQAWVQTQQSILSSDVFSGLRTSAPSPLRSQH